MSVTAAVKAAAALLKSKKGRKILKIAVGFAIGIFILIAGVLFTIVNAVSGIGKSLQAGYLEADHRCRRSSHKMCSCQEIQASLTKLDSAVETAKNSWGRTSWMAGGSER